MKRLFSAALAIAVIVAAAVPVSAKTLSSYNPGEVYVKDDEYYDEDAGGTIAPGSSVWVFLEPYVAGQTKAPKSIKFQEVSVWDPDSDKEVKILSVDKTATRLKVNSSERGWFAKVTAKSVSASSYPEDGYDITECVLEFYSYNDDSTIDDVDVGLTAVAYEEADDEFEDDPKMFTYEKDDDVDIDLPDSAGTFTGVARKDFDIVAAMNTDVDNSLLNKYPNADIRFFNGNGANFPVTSGKLTIYADSNDYLYEVSGSTLTDRSSTWSSSKNAFVVNTTIIGKYIVSDTKLSAKASTDSTGTSSSTASSSQSEYIGSTPLPSNPVITNPQTGACA